MTKTTNPGTPTAAIIAAAGEGSRLGAGIPKAFVELAGRTLLERSVAGLAASASVSEIVVVAHPTMVAEARRIVASRAAVIAGRGERADSVRAGVEYLAQQNFPHSAAVLVHDAARALTPVSLIDRVIAALSPQRPAVIPVLPVADTIKEIVDGQVRTTLDRSRLGAVQTPQGFRFGELLAANQRYEQEQPELAVTDDASLMEWAGYPVHTVAGDPWARKITTPIDLIIARALLAEGTQP